MSLNPSIRSLLAVFSTLLVVCVGTAAVAADDAENSARWGGAAQGQFLVDTAFDVVSTDVEKPESAKVGVSEGLDTEDVDIDEVEDEGWDREARHLVVSMTARTLPRQIRGVRQCLPDGLESHGRYTVAFVAESDLDERAFAQSVMGNERGRTDDRRPEVRLVFNFEDGDWVYELGAGWHDREGMRRYFDEQLVGRQVRVELDSAVDDACRLVGFFDNFLESAGGDIDRYFEFNQIDRRESLLRRNLAASRGDVRGDERFGVDEDSPFYQNDFGPLFSEAEEYWRQTRKALRADDIEEARELVEQTADRASELQDMADRLKELRSDFRQMERQSEEQREDLMIRRQSFVPFGSEVGDRLQQCQRELEEFEVLLQLGASLEETELWRDEVDSCVAGIDAFVADTEGSFRLRGIYGPLGVLGIALALGGFLFVRRRREALRVDPDAGHLIDEWGKRVPVLRRRLDGMVDENPDIFKTADPARIRHRLDPEARETIDHALILGDRAEALLHQAEAIFDDINRTSSEKYEDLKQILGEEETELHPDNTASSTRLQDRLQQWYAHDHSELLDDLEELVEQAEECLEPGGS